MHFLMYISLTHNGIYDDASHHFCLNEANKQRSKKVMMLNLHKGLTSALPPYLRFIWSPHFQHNFLSSIVGPPPVQCARSMSAVSVSKRSRIHCRCISSSYQNLHLDFHLEMVKDKKGAYIYACQLRQIEGSPSYTKAQGSAYNVIKPLYLG